MQGKCSLYSTIIGLITFILIIVGIFSGMKTALYVLFVPLFLLIVINLLFRYLQEVLASIITALLIVITVHIIFKLWMVTILLFSYLSVVILANYAIKNKKWSSIVMHSVSILSVIILFYLVLQKNL